MAKKKTPKKIKFAGRVVDSKFDFQGKGTDVVGPHHVMYPKSTADVATAVALSQNLRTFIRSGANVSKQDTVDGSGGVVINMKEMSKIDIKDKSLKAQAAATSEAIAEQLAEHKLALPLTDNPLKSIASDVLHENPSYLARSLGPLSNYVSKIRAVRPDGRKVTLKDSAKESSLEKCRSANAVVTEVEFKPAPAKDLWMFRATFPYPGKEEFAAISKALFLNTKFTKQLEQTDLALDAFNGPFDIPLIRISAMGSTSSGKAKLKKLLKEAIALLPKQFESEDVIEESFSGPEVMSALTEMGMGPSPEALVESSGLRDAVESTGEIENFLTRHAQNVHRGIAYDRETGKRDGDTRMSACLRVNRENGLDVSGHIHTPTVEDSSVVRTRATPFHLGAEARMPRALAAVTRDDVIPNFKGDVYTKSDWGYKSRAEQYATSSYPSSKMTPFMVAYPRDDRDIIAAIVFAKSKKKSVVARSGGHQYSGKSSGGSDTIVLSMDNFDQLDRQAEGAFRVGPAVRLTNLAKRFQSERVTIPHGECPQVAIGGHAQTGGYGHLIRSFGLCLDYVSGFEIILSDGSKRTVTRPQIGTSTTKANDELFWGVLGGNAGSFGIVTSYDFDCIKDRNHPNSYGFTMRRRYKESAFFKLMKEAQKWTQKIETGTLKPGIDFMMTVASSKALLPLPVLLVELVDANLGGPSQPVDGEQVFKPIIKAAKYKSGLWSLFSSSGPESLSSLSQSFVRTWPGVTLDGREFKYPYKKRVNCTTSELSDEFVDEFVKKISHVVLNESRVKLVFQMAFGGGAYKNSSRRAQTSIPHRDGVYCFVFDLFYKSGGEATAVELQREMQDLIDNHFSGDQEKRVFWGTFGDTDISKQSIRDMYYDSEEQYARLQELKKEVDPVDLFHTSLTVQLPD